MPPEQTRNEPHWSNAFFDDDYADFGLATDDAADVEGVADFIISALGVQPGQVVFDQCCGIGRMSVPLASKGLRVIGVDFVPSYVERARQAAAELPCEFHCGDAHVFTAPEPCDGAINWFTSFGYHDDDERNVQLFQRAADSLKPGAKYVLDYQNFPRIWRDYQRCLADRRAVDGKDDLIVLQENTPDYIAGVMRTAWTFLYPDGRREVRNVCLRMYMPHEIVNLLKHCGFGDFELFGSARTGEAFTRSSMRLIVVATKQ